MIDLMKVTGTDGKEYRVPVAAVDAIVARNRRHTAAAPGEAELYARLEELAKAIMRRPAPYSDELGRKHYELAHDTLKLLRARALRDSDVN